MSIGGGGGGGNCATLSENLRGTEIEYWERVTGSISGDGYDANVATGSVEDLSGPIICSLSPIPAANARAIAPDATVLPAHLIETEVSGYYSMTLPLEAYSYPGRWQLQIDGSDLDVTVNVSSPERPFAIWYGEELPSGRIVIGGFMPNERVVALLFEPSISDFHRADHVGDVQFAVDANGYRLLDTEPGFWLIFLGEYGSVAVTGPGDYSDLGDPLSAQLHDYAWGVDGIGRQTSTQCEGSPPTRLAGLEQARVVYGAGANRIRATIETGSVLGSIPEGGVFRILSEPVCGSGTSQLTWYQVEYNGIVGWTAEGQGNVYWLEPYSDEVVLCSGSPPPRLVGLEAAHVVYGTGPNSIRAGIESGTVLGSIPEGEQFRILSGPVCGSSTMQLTWYQVEYNGIVGWTAEGRGSVYWLEP